MVKEKTQAEKAKEALDIANAAKETESIYTPPTADKKEADKKEADAKKSKKDAEVLEPKKKKGFINPLDKGVSYDEFLDSVPEKKSISTHLKGKLEEKDILWIVEDIKLYKALKKNK